MIERMFAMINEYLLMLDLYLIRLPFNVNK